MNEAVVEYIRLGPGAPLLLCVILMAFSFLLVLKNFNFEMILVRS